jgi:hypothetical protein
MRNPEQCRALRGTIRKQKGEVRKMQDFMDTLTDYEVWNEAARHLAELLDWIDHNQKLHATLRWGR